LSLSVDNLIWIEHRDRELGYAKALAAELRAAGLGSTLILSMPFFLPLGFFLRPRRVFVPYLKSRRDPQLSILRQGGGQPPQVISLNFEQLLGHFNREAKRPTAEGALHCYWYEEFAEVLAAWAVPQASWVKLPPPESMLVSRRAFQERFHVQGGTKGDFDRVIFIPENYSWAFATEEVLRKKAMAGFNAEQIERLRRYSDDSLTLFCEQLLECARRQPGILFIVRPHPSVDVASYRRRIERVADLPDNVVLSKALSAWDWLGGCDGVLSSWSTVTYSARQMGIPAALHLPLPLIPELDVPWVRSMPTFDQLSDAVEHVLRRGKDKPQTPGQGGFDALFDKLGNTPAPASMPERSRLPERLRVLLRASAASVVRLAGLALPSPRARVLRVYRHDFVAPLRVE
jgi:hypothetical protein